MPHKQRGSSGARLRAAKPTPRLFFLAFLAILAAELAAHASLLRLPYYWDEAGYYIPAAFDLYRTGTLIPFSTLTNAHPPGLSLVLAGAWKLFGFAPVTTRVTVCVAASLALAAVFRLALFSLRSYSAAAAVALLTACYPVWFTQSTMAHADMLAAAATLWGVALILDMESGETKADIRRWHIGAACACFIGAALTKEIAIGTPLLLAGYELSKLLRGQGSRLRCGALCLPLLPLAAWFAYHRRRTGFTFGNPEYLRYNAGANLSPERFLLALGHRVLHLSAHLNLFVPVLIALGSLVLPRLPARAALPPALRTRLWVVIAGNAVLFSLLGGALLTRYLLPIYPLVLLLAVAAVYGRLRQWLWYPAVSAAAFLAALLLPPPYRVAPEDTLAYRDAILLEQHAVAIVAARYPSGAVLTAWPYTDALRKPELGYITRPFAVVSIDNFSPEALQAAQPAAPAYSTAIVFSTKYVPPGAAFGLGRWLSVNPWDEQQEVRFFGLHRDLDAASVAQLLGGTVIWQERRGSQSAAVLRFAHPELARASHPDFYNAD